MAAITAPTTSQAGAGHLRARHVWGITFYGLLLFCVLFGLLVLGALLVDVTYESLPMLTPRLGAALTPVEEGEAAIDPSTLPLFSNNVWSEFPSRHADEAGMKSGIIGSLIVVGITALVSLPLGVGAAIYLEEYAPRNAITEFISVNIANLAGVPSIVYGMLGVTVFVRFFGLITPDNAFAQSIAGLVGAEIGGRGLNVIAFNFLGIEWLPLQFPFGRSLLAGGLTMTLLALPTIIIASREAIRAVPPSIREAAYGLGATRWQVISRQVLPIAFPGIMTGLILSLSRGIGETAPLIVMGAFTYIAFMPDNIWDVFTVMPIQIYNWISLPQEEFRVHLAAAGIVIMLAVLLSLNAIAVYLRNRFQIKW